MKALERLCKALENLLAILEGVFVNDHNPYHDKHNGRFTTGGGGLTNEGKRGTIEGQNTAHSFRRGFSPESLKRHWKGGISDHSRDYPGYTKKQYVEEALALIESPTSETVRGFTAPGGYVARYDKSNGNYIVGHPERGIKTMFKPDNKEEYFEREMKRIHGTEE